MRKRAYFGESSSRGTHELPSINMFEADVFFALVLVLIVIPM